MKNKRARKIVYPLLLLLTLYIVAGMALSKRKDQILYRPQTLDSGYTFKAPYPYKTFNIPVNPGEKLNILYLYTDSAKGQLLYFHNNEGNISTHLNEVIPFLEKGYNVFLPDYPGYGKSTGTPTESALYESAQVLYELSAKYMQSDSTFIYGEGLGGAVAAYLASRHNCKALIINSTFYSLQAIAHHYFPIYPVKKYLKDEFPVYHFLQRTTAPIFLFQGAKDHTIPLSQGKMLAKVLDAKDHFIVLPHAGHEQVTSQTKYKAVIDSLLEK